MKVIKSKSHFSGNSCRCQFRFEAFEHFYVWRPYRHCCAWSSSSTFSTPLIHCSTACPHASCSYLCGSGARGTCCGSAESCTLSCGCCLGPAQKSAAIVSCCLQHFSENSGVCRHLILCCPSGCRRMSCYAAVVAQDA